MSTGLPGHPQRPYNNLPDVQIIVLEDLDRFVSPQPVEFSIKLIVSSCRAFVSYIEKAFRDRGLKCDVTVSSVQMAHSVLERLIRDGIGSVVRLSRASAVTARIPLQVFDHSLAPANVRYEGELMSSETIRS